jgi:TPP-dependent pyruvate/acetoin dehydrogenase alpha subunit
MTDSKLLSLFEKIVYIRVLENKLQDYCNRGLAGDLHFNKGQEAIAVGVCAALKETDYIVTHHRTIAHQIAKGAALEPLIAELLGKRTGVNGGHAGEMHISDPAIRYAFSFQLVGTCIPVAAGLAWALTHHHHTDDIVAVFFGDAASSNGQFHEGLNLAAVRQVPLLMICENNHLAGNIRPSYYMTGKSVAGLALSHEVAVEQVDGNDIRAVVATTEQAADYVRRYKKPFFLECMTERLSWHKQGQRDIRSREELLDLSMNEPVKRLSRQLPGKYEELEERIDRELTAILKKVEAELPPHFIVNRQD